MPHWIRSIYEFPIYHIAMAWWVGVTGVILLKPIWRLIRQLPIWGMKLYLKNARQKLRTLEGLHNNTYGLVIYLAGDAADVAFDLAWTCVGVAILSKKLASLGSILFYVSLQVGSSLLGRAMRVRGILRGLRSYDETVAELRRLLRNQDDDPPIAPSLTLERSRD